MSRRRNVLLVVLSPFAAVASLVVAGPILLAVAAAAAVNAALCEWRFSREMRSLGRFRNWRDLAARMEYEIGTLIIENPSLGWNHTHAWWTPDDLLRTAPCTQPDDEAYRQAAKTMKSLPWDKWCYDNYTSPETGRAMLLRVWDGRSLQQKLQRRSKKLNVVYTWTGLIWYERFCSLDDEESSQR